MCVPIMIIIHCVFLLVAAVILLLFGHFMVMYNMIDVT